MHVNAVVLGLSALLLGRAWAGVIDYIDQYPACGLACVTELLPGSVCQTPTNDSCICADASFAALVQPCILTQCTVIEALTVQRVQAGACNTPVRSRRNDFWGIVAVEVITLPCAVLRLWARHALDQEYRWDDYLMMAVIPLWLAFTVCGNVAAWTAFGVDLYTIADPGVISTGTELFWVCEIFYFVALGLCKLMVVCFLLRIFPHPTFHRTAYAIMAYVGLFTIVAEGCLIFQCVPVQSIWLGWRGDFGAYTCLNVNRMTLVLAVQQILQDLLILGLPVPLLLKLNTSTRKKLSIFFMFSLGIFVVVTSCVRLQYLLVMGDSKNPTYDYTDVIIWTGLELDVSVIVASLPALRKYLGLRFETFGSSKDGPCRGSGPSSGARYRRDYKAAREHGKATGPTWPWRLSSWSNVASQNDVDGESQIELGLGVKGTTQADVSTSRHACCGSGDPLNGSIIVSSQTVVSSRKAPWEAQR